MILREAKNDDLQDILKLYQQLFPEEDYSNINMFKPKWLEIMHDEKITYFIAYCDKIPVSTCQITIIPNLTRNRRSYAVIENVITHASYRKKGYGKAVMKKAIDHAKLNKCYKIMLMSDYTRKEAHEFYDKIGFVGNTKKGFQLRIP